MVANTNTPRDSHVQYDHLDGGGAVDDDVAEDVVDGVVVGCVLRELPLLRIVGSMRSSTHVQISDWMQV